MTTVEAAWVGAMIEAEGSVVIRTSTAPGRSGYHELKVVVGNTDPEIISALLRLVGAGTVCVKTFSKQWQRKMCFSWQVQAREDVREIARQCAPFSMKLQKVEVQHS